MTDLERIKKDVVEMDSRANVCWYDTKVLTKAVRLILEELTADRKTEPMTTNLEWLKTLSAEELADWFYDEWLHHLQYRWSSSRGGLIIWLKDRKTEPTISKMEQVEDEPQTCDNCKLKGSTKWCNNQVVCRAYKPMDEPQTEPLHTCSVNGRPYSECSSCEHFKCTADEPQTDCPWK